MPITLSEIQAMGLVVLIVCFIGLLILLFAKDKVMMFDHYLKTLWVQKTPLRTLNPERLRQLTAEFEFLSLEDKLSLLQRLTQRDVHVILGCDDKHYWFVALNASGENKFEL